MPDRLRIGLVVPHMFMHRDILQHVIFSPGRLALDLANGLSKLQAGFDVQVTLFSPGPVDTASAVSNITADLTYFEHELSGRGDSYLDLLKKHPFTFVTLARQVQAELIAKAYAMANRGELDLVHIYMNEEDVALPFADLCRQPVVFSHHDPFNFLIKYKNVFPKYRQMNWLSMSYAQRRGMPADTNWIANIYHGIDPDVFTPVQAPTSNYIAYMGRIIESKGTHLAIAAVKAYNQANPPRRLRLKLAGKHYAGKKDRYWQEAILPLLDENIEYVGFISDDGAKRDFLANAAAVVVPSTFDEPFGMALIETLACGTPVIGLDSGAIPEIIRDGVTGYVVAKPTGMKTDETMVADALGKAINNIPGISREACRQDFLERFTLERMCRKHMTVYETMLVK